MLEEDQSSQAEKKKKKNKKKKKADVRDLPTHQDISQEDEIQHLGYLKKQLEVLEQTNV